MCFGNYSINKNSFSSYVTDLVRLSFSEPHFKDSHNIYPHRVNTNCREPIKIQVVKVNTVALYIMSLFTLGMAWLVYNLYTAKKKLEVIRKNNLNLNDIISTERKQEKAITFQLSGGRLGDNLMCLLSSYYVAHKHNIPFYYTPFEGSNDFVLNEKISALASNFKFKETKSLSSFNSIEEACREDGAKSCLISIKPFADVKVDWNDSVFRQKARELIKLHMPTASISRPAGKISIALHMRMGGGFDSEAEKRRVPTKFPPINFYEQGIRQMIDSYGKEKAFYIHLFTDHPNPGDLANQLKAKFPDVDIEFGFRQGKNSHDSGVYADMFGMSKFEALIRPWSGLSQVAEIIGIATKIFEPDHWMDPLNPEDPFEVPGKLTLKSA